MDKLNEQRNATGVKTSFDWPEFMLGKDNHANSINSSFIFGSEINIYVRLTRKLKWH